MKTNETIMKTMTHKKLIRMRRIHALTIIGKLVRVWSDEIGRVHYRAFWVKPLLSWERRKVRGYSKTSKYDRSKVGGQPITDPFGS